MKILLIRPDHIGDMLLTTPFFSALRKGFPEAEIDMLAGSWSIPVMKNNPNVDNIIKCDFPWLSRGGETPWKKLISCVFSLKRKRYDIVLNLRKAMKSSAVALAIGGKKIYGFDVGKSSWAHDIKINYRTNLNIADLYLEFTGALGIEIDHNGIELFFDEKEIEIFSKKVDNKNGYIVFSPGAGYKEKFWFEKSWAETADIIIEKYSKSVVFSGGPGEIDMIENISSEMKNDAVSYAGKLNLREAMLLIKNSVCTVSVDSAAMHIASGVKTPVVALFGPTNPIHWGPYPNGCRNVVISKIKEFSLGRGSTNKEGGMELIVVEDVIKAVDQILMEN